MKVRFHSQLHLLYTLHGEVCLDLLDLQIHRKNQVTIFHAIYIWNTIITFSAILERISPQKISQELANVLGLL